MWALSRLSFAVCWPSPELLGGLRVYNIGKGWVGNHIDVQGRSAWFQAPVFPCNHGIFRSSGLFGSSNNLITTKSTTYNNYLLTKTNKSSCSSRTKKNHRKLHSSMSFCNKILCKGSRCTRYHCKPNPHFSLM